MKKTGRALVFVTSAFMACSLLSFSAFAAQNESNLMGDVNGDGKITVADATKVQRILADIEKPTDAMLKRAMVTNGKKLSINDVTNIQKYIAELKYEGTVGETVEFEEQFTVTFKDYNGKVLKTQTVEMGKAATAPENPTRSGYKFIGWDQDFDFITEDIVITAQYNYEIRYYTNTGDNYLQSIKIDNPNPDNYSSDEGLYLEDLMVNGYYFKGWYTAQTGGTRVEEIAEGSKGAKRLYAQWEKIVYTVNFDSPDVPIDSVTYTVDKGVTVTNPSWYGYTFVGWSDDNGFIINRIKPGTTGNITLHANWTSNRNRATSYSNYGEPILIEDDKNGQFLFVYDIGKIDNVPLQNIEYIGNTQTLKIDKDYQVTDYISSDTAKTLANSVSNATTRSSGWTLSKEWNDTYTDSSSTTQGRTQTDVRTDSEGNTVGGNYFVSNSKGGSSYSSSESGGSSSVSAKVTTENSKGINYGYANSTEKYVDAKLGVKNETEVSAGISLPVDIVKVSAGVKNTTTLSAEVASGRRDKSSSYFDGKVSSYVGTSVDQNSSSYFNSSSGSSSNWNSTESYEKSYQNSRSTEISKSISDQLIKTTGYSITNSLGGAEARTETVGGTDTRKDEYSSTVKYSEGTNTTTTKHVTFTSDRPGYYRLVTAGTVHVFGVVGYDVATSSYYSYTFNVLDDERHEYLDYSKDNANFNDCENGLVTFEIPYDVNEYIAGITGRTNGIEYELGGVISDFEQTEDFEGTVVVPQYYSVNNGDGTYSAYKTTGFKPNVFAGNTSIKTVVLPVYVTEIPDGAFAGCTNLQEVIALGVTKIGENAFSGCTSLKKFLIDNKVTSLGISAFEDVSELEVMAANANAANAAIDSGAKKISLNLTKMSGSYDNKKILISDITDYFALIGGGKTYKNLSVESSAKETFISNLTLTENKDTPFNLNSNIVNLSRVTVAGAPGFALIMPKDNTTLKLYGTVVLGSGGENAVLSRSTNLVKANPEVAGTLSLTGNYLVCGDVNNAAQRLTFESGKLVNITESQFRAYLSSCVVTFDANGGSITGDVTKSVYYGQTYGELPTPTKSNYTFDGWYTTKDGGTNVTAETPVSSLVNHTLYAHWINKKFTVSFNANGGSVSAASKTVAYNTEYGELPTPTKDYNKFLGWFTAVETGKEITAETIADSSVNITLYAHWESKGTSGWILESNLPDGAKIVDTKYTYIQREYTENSSDTLSGWTKYDTKRTSWGSTQGPVYSDPSNGLRNVWSEQYVSSTTTHYCYYHRCGQGQNVSTGTWGTVWGTDSSLGSGARHSIDLTYALTNKSKYVVNTQFYSGPACSSCGQAYMWASDGTYTSNNYSTRWYYQEPVYTYYYYQDVNKESISTPSGNNISNTQKWVKYIEK